MKVDIQKFLLKNPQGQNAEITAASTALQDMNLTKNNLDFNSILSDTKVASTQGAFQSLLCQLEKQEKALFRNPSISNISAYKRIVKDIMSTVANNFKVEEISLFSNEGCNKLIKYSEAIDEKLEFIMKDFLENNKLSLGAIDAFADIKGILIDLTT